MDEKAKKDIDVVIREEERRGRRPIDFAARRKRMERLADMQKFLKLRTEKEFLKAMRDEVGLIEGSQALLACLEIWRNYRC